MNFSSRERRPFDLRALEPRMLFDGAGAASYEATDPSAECPPNQAPIACDDLRTVDHDNRIDDGQVIAGTPSGDVADSDPDGDCLTVTGLSLGDADDAPRGEIGQAFEGAFGTLVMQADGSYTYTPNADLEIPRGMTVSDVFRYRICDERGGEATANLVVRVSCDDCNTPPIALADHRLVYTDQRINDGQAIRGNALGDNADSDPDGDSLTVTSITAVTASNTKAPDFGRAHQPGERVQGQYGELTIQADGSYVYVPYAVGGPAADETVTDHFVYAVSDGHGGLASANLDIDVRAPALAVSPDNPVVPVVPVTPIVPITPAPFVPPFLSRLEPVDPPMNPLLPVSLTGFRDPVAPADRLLLPRDQFAFFAPERIIGETDLKEAPRFAGEAPAVRETQAAQDSQSDVPIPKPKAKARLNAVPVARPASDRATNDPGAQSFSNQVLASRASYQPTARPVPTPLRERR